MNKSICIYCGYMVSDEASMIIMVGFMSEVGSHGTRVGTESSHLHSQAQGGSRALTIHKRMQNQNLNA